VDTPSGRKKHALITGASSGIGKEIAKALAAEAYQPILVGRHRDTLEQAAREILGERGTDAVICPADLSEGDAPQAIFDHLHERGITVDLLVNNAGLLFDGDFTAIALQDHLQLLHVNVVALTAMTRLFIEPMLRVNAQAFSFEVMNPRHMHDYHAFEDVKLPEGKTLIPGMVVRSTPRMR